MQSPYFVGRLEEEMVALRWWWSLGLSFSFTFSDLFLRCFEEVDYKKKLGQLVVAMRPMRIFKILPGI